jgi:hypothetical protein
MAADRPGFNGPAAVVGPGTVQVEFGWSTTYDPSNGDASVSPQPTLRLGLTRRLELQIVSGGWASSCAFDCAWQATDMAAGVRVLLASQEELGVALAVTSLLSFPTGSDATTSGGVSPLVILHADRALTPDLELSLNYQWLHERADALSAVRHGVGVGLGYSVGDLIPFVNVSRRPVRIDNRAPWLLESGLGYMITRDIQLDAGVSRGLNRPEDDWGVFGGISLRRRPR